MFKDKSVAEFNSDGHKATFIIENDMPISAVQAILNEIMYYCVDRIKHAEQEELQALAEKEMEKKPDLEMQELAVPEDK